MELIKFIVKENIKEGYSLKEQIIDGLGIITTIVLLLLFLG